MRLSGLFELVHAQKQRMNYYWCSATRMIAEIRLVEKWQKRSFSFSSSCDDI